MDSNQADFFELVLDESGIDYERREDYSGRGMFGKTCHGLVIDEDPVTILSILLNSIRKNEFEVVREQFDGIVVPKFNIRTDNMGRSALIYY